MPVANELWYLGFGRELTPGTASLAGTFAPVIDIKPSDKYNYQPDKGIRGSFVEQYADIATQAWGELGFDMDFFPDIFGWFLKGLLGDETATGSSPGAGTTLSATATAGATSFTTASNTGLTALGYVQIDTGSAAEVVIINTITGTGPYTVTLLLPVALTRGHASGVAVVPVAPPVTHSFSVLNSGSGQPPTTTLIYYNGFNARKMPFGLFSELAIKYDASNLIKVSGKAAGFASSTVTPPAKSFSTLTPQPSWKAAATIGGVATGLLESADITIKRDVAPIVAINGTQAPYKMWSRAVSVAGKATIIYEDDTFLSDYTAGAPVAFDLAFTTGAGVAQVGLTVHCTSAQFIKADVVMGSKGFTQLDIDFRGEGNTTDAGASGGSSNVKVTLLNAQPTY